MRTWIALLVAGLISVTASISVYAEEDANAALDRAQQHLMDAMKAFGDAGRQAYEKHSPAIQKKAREMMDEMREFMQQWGDQTPTDSPPDSQDQDHNQNYI